MPMVAPGISLSTRPLVSSDKLGIGFSHLFLQRVTVFLQGIGQTLIGGAQNAHSQKARVRGTGIADRSGGDRNTPGICTMDNSESQPDNAWERTGTPMTGEGGLGRHHTRQSVPRRQRRR